MNLRPLNILMPVLWILAIASTPALAIDKQELQTRFEKRYPQLLQFKTAGKIGETMQGFVEFVDPKFRSEQPVAKLVEEENADRRELYKLIAEEEKTTPDLVAERTAKRNYEKARAGEYLKSADGSWKKKS
jgi:uncharacterized protein